jgi:hypothetical protein
MRQRHELVLVYGGVMAANLRRSIATVHPVYATIRRCMALRLPEAWRDDEVLGFFNRHLVPIYLDLRRGEQEHQMVLSAFVFSAFGRWLLMTAGHCITDVGKLRNDGWKVNRARLLDGLNSNAEHPLTVPFDYDSFRPTMLGVEETFDYGILIPTVMAVQAMQANKVVPLAEGSWDHEDREFGLYKILGVPNDLVAKSHIDLKGIGTMFQRVDRLKKRPEGFAKTKAPMFYGKLRGDPIVKLKGMSGGPIFGFVNEEGGQQRYWLVAMQVSTVRTKYISGMLIRPLGRLIQQMAKDLQKKKDPRKAPGTAC